ncbi:MAG: hypothetical protein JJE36_06785 [Coriobacteriia bacterium]|nr:hypothetical protein [Coriobacteriia bacterium]
MLRNFEVISELRARDGIEVRSSQKLNNILERMGLIENIGGDWWPTDFGMQYSPYSSKTLRANEWLESIVDYIAENLE